MKLHECLIVISKTPTRRPGYMPPLGNIESVDLLAGVIECALYELAVGDIYHRVVVRDGSRYRGFVSANTFEKYRPTPYPSTLTAMDVSRIIGGQHIIDARVYSISREVADEFKTQEFVDQL